MKIHVRLALVVVIFMASACGKATPAATSAPDASAPATGGLPWLAPPDPLTLAKNAGLYLERKETLVYHVHAHIDVFVNGQQALVPAGIGINIKDPGVQHGAGPSYGGIKLCDQPCISPLHTHDTSGVIHTESKTATPNKLGQFFVEWAVRLDRSCVGGYCKPSSSIQIVVNGKRFTGDPRTIELSDKKEIVIIIGSPPKTIPKSFPV